MNYDYSSHDNPRLTPEMISEPRMHRLVIIVYDNLARIVITSQINPTGVVCRDLAFDPERDVVSAFEEVVYDNPLLTADFHSVDVILTGNRFFVMHREDADSDELRRRIDALWPPEQQSTALMPLVNDIENDRTVMVSAVERPLLAFIRRTWDNPRIYHRLAVMARYHGLKNHLGNMGKIHAIVSERYLDLLAFGRDGLLMANTFDTHGSIDDATYYTMAMAQNLDFDNDIDRILVDGPGELRDAYVNSVRRFVTTVMPFIRPSAISQMGNTAPLEALLMPLI